MRRWNARTRIVRGIVTTIDAAAWFYAVPFAEAAEVAGYLSFDGTGIDLEVTDN